MELLLEHLERAGARANHHTHIVADGRDIKARLRDRLMCGGQREMGEHFAAARELAVHIDRAGRSL